MYLASGDTTLWHEKRSRFVQVANSSIANPPLSRHRSVTPTPTYSYSPLPQLRNLRRMPSELHVTSSFGTERSAFFKKFDKQVQVTLQTNTNPEQRRRRLYEYFDGDPEQGGSSSEDEEHTEASLRKDDRVILNVGGIKFMTYRGTLLKLPNTRLGMLAKNVKDRHKFYFDRDPEMFMQIIDLYRTGHIHFSANYCREKIEEDLDYWRIDLEAACSTCFKNMFLEQEEAEFTARNLEKEFDWRLHMEFPDEPKNSWRYRIFSTLDNPSYSKLAWAYGMFFLACIFISVTTFIASTVDVFLQPVEQNHSKILQEASAIDDRIGDNAKAQKLLTYRLHTVLIVLDNLTAAVFMFDILVRFITCPIKLKFITSPLNIIDVIVTIPLAITVLLRWAFMHTLSHSVQAAITYAFLDAVKLLRSARVFRFTSRYSSLRVLVIALRDSVSELILLMVFITTGMVLFATLVYYSEFWEKESHFSDIPTGFWWAVITMTTVGYGDMKPISGWGYVVGSFCAISGIVFLALPIPIIGNNFGIYYNYALDRRRKQAAKDARQQERRFEVQKMTTKFFGKFGGGAGASVLHTDSGRSQSDLSLRHRRARLAPKIHSEHDSRRKRGTEKSSDGTVTGNRISSSQSIQTVSSTTPQLMRAPGGPPLMRASASHPISMSNTARRQTKRKDHRSGGMIANAILH